MSHRHPAMRYLSSKRCAMRIDGRPPISATSKRLITRHFFDLAHPAGRTKLLRIASGQRARSRHLPQWVTSQVTLGVT